jgi:branched-chain amino acid transport system permease protein
MGFSAGRDMSEQIQSAATAPARTPISAVPFLAEGAILVAAVAAYLAFPDSLGVLTRIIIMMMFVLSIDLVLGYAGIATLGQAAMYGTGAYAAGLCAVYVVADPLVGLVVGAAAGAAIAFISGLMLMRVHGLTLLMMSIAVAQICQEIANKAGVITGGADGLTGIAVNPLLGLFEFDLVGRTAYWYAFAVFAGVFLFLRMLVASPLGLTAMGIRESSARMAAIGTPVYWRLVVIYIIGGAISGIAGAMSAQVTELVSLDVYSFVLSAEAVLMLILGGTGRLYGAVLGTAIFMGVQYLATAADAFTWLFVIGGMVLVVVFFIPKGMLDLPVALQRLWKGAM